MNEQPLVSVFIPYYNDEKYLSCAIDAVINQTYQNWELILFNHVSTDNSYKIAHSYKDPRIKHIDAQTNLGAGSGYNIKISLPYMNGKYIKLLCADDYMKEDCLENLVFCLESNPDKDIVFSDMDYVDDENKSLHNKWSNDIPMSDFVSDENITLAKFFHGYSHIAYPAALIKMEAIKSIQLDISMVMLFDVSLWIKLLVAGKKIMFYPHSTINYRIHNNQMSSRKNIERAVKSGAFELYQLLDLFYGIKDINLIKQICPSKYSAMLNDGDEEFIPFCIAYYWASMYPNNNWSHFKDQHPTRELFGATKIYYLLKDENFREKLKNKFNFGIKEFREIYTWIPSDDLQEEEMLSHFTFIDHILKKDVYNLSIFQLFVIALWKILKSPIKKYINFQNSIKNAISSIIEKIKKKQKYTI